MTQTVCRQLSILFWLLDEIENMNVAAMVSTGSHNARAVLVLLPVKLFVVKVDVLGMSIVFVKLLPSMRHIIEKYLKTIQSCSMSCEGDLDMLYEAYNGKIKTIYCIKNFNQNLN